MKYAGPRKDTRSFCDLSPVRCTRRAASVRIQHGSWQADSEAKIGEIELQVQLLADEAGKVGELQKRFDTKVAVLDFVKQASEAKKASFEVKDQVLLLRTGIGDGSGCNR